MKGIIEVVAVCLAALFITVLGIVLNISIYSCAMGLILYLCNWLLGTTIPAIEYAIISGVLMVTIQLIIGKLKVTMEVK